jgi:hypothetical protein
MTAFGSRAIEGWQASSAWQRIAVDLDQRKARD